MTRDEVVNTILIKIDEISPFQEPDEQFTLLIDGLLDDAANSFLRLIPLHLVRGIEQTLSTATLNTSPDINYYTSHDLGVWDIPANANFLRMTRCVCEQWERPVVGVIPVTDTQYEKEFNRFTASGNSKPKIYDDTSSNRRFILAPYHHNSSKNDIKLYYIPSIPRSDRATSGNQQYGIPEEILDAFFYYAASYVLTSMQRNDYATMMTNKFAETITNRQ